MIKTKSYAMHKVIQHLLVRPLMYNVNYSFDFAVGGLIGFLLPSDKKVKPNSNENKI